MLSLEQYSDLTVQLISSNVTSQNPVMTAAALGEQLRRSAPDSSFRSYGYTRFLRYLDYLEGRQKIVLTKTDQQALAVTLRSDLAPPPVISTGYNPLRKPVWGAFVFSAPPGQRFLNRLSGLVRMGLQGAPSPVDEWVEIELLSESIQKVWATEFLEHEKLDSDALTKALDSHQWHLDFPVALEQINQSKRIRWNRFRSAKVAKVVDEWCHRNKIDLSMVFSTPSDPTVPQEPVPSDNKRDHRVEDIQRQWILAALATLPLEALQALPLPAGAMIKTNPKINAVLS
ncbi:hypothetical protein ELE36_02635 [Pseudolysobacter antarcticus]|uniref:HTH OST-type domain-containing protein n=1 Tax=Pseudolysobacter antarcticus TaxID=2511995 RepID=A0A411HFT9_9GAMM|nr:hypothetical protein [Pseudolysobacter antarcticus]QBB69358.1 hypothetical protein ELE36_02635 [Pseudolysobacter antarcticus]